MADELLTSSEAARMLRVSKATITRYVRLAQLPAIRLPSGHLRIRRRDIERLLQQADELEPDR
jgi:excisionase family DNA binding protein